MSELTTYTVHYEDGNSPTMPFSRELAVRRHLARHGCGVEGDPDGRRGSGRSRGRLGRARARL